MDEKFFLWMLWLISACSASDDVFNENPALHPRFYHLDWMKSVPDRTPVSAIAIPGTHESLSEYGGPLTQRQVWNLNVQLKAGIRYLDLHVGIWIPDQQHVYIWDGWWMISQQIRMDEVLVIVFNFLELHRSETVLLNVEVHGLYKTRVVQMIKKMITQNRDRIWTDPEVPTMGQVRGKLVFVKSGTFDGVEKRRSAFFLDNKLEYAECKIEQVKPLLCGRSILVTENPRAVLRTPKGLARTVNGEINRCVVQNRKSVNQGCLGVISMNFPRAAVLRNIIQLRPCSCAGEPEPTTAPPQTTLQGTTPPTEPCPEEPPPCEPDIIPSPPPIEPCPEEPPPCEPDIIPPPTEPFPEEPPPCEPDTEPTPPPTEPCPEEPPPCEPDIIPTPPPTEPCPEEPPPCEPDTEPTPPPTEPCPEEPPPCDPDTEPTAPPTEPCPEEPPPCEPDIIPTPPPTEPCPEEPPPCEPDTEPTPPPTEPCPEEPPPCDPDIIPTPPPTEPCPEEPPPCEPDTEPTPPPTEPCPEEPPQCDPDIIPTPPPTEPCPEEPPPCEPDTEPTPVLEPLTFESGSRSEPRPLTESSLEETPESGSGPEVLSKQASVPSSEPTSPLSLPAPPDGGTQLTSSQESTW